jgi:hypothetical protein
MDGKGLAILILLFLIALMVLYPQKRSDYMPSEGEPMGAPVTTSSVSGSGPMINQGGSGGVISQGSLADSPGGMMASVDDPAPFSSEGGIRTVDMPVYDNTNVGLIPKEVVTTEDFGQFSPDAILSGQNFLDPRAQIGFPETIGGNLRNANRDFRSEPPNPRSPVSIFNLSTIPPDTMRPKFEIENSYEQ